MKYHPLFPRFPGSKRRHLQLPDIRPIHTYDLSLEPFAGAANMTHYCLQNGLVSRAIVGECDRLVRSVWQVWHLNDLDMQISFQEQITFWKDIFGGVDPDQAWEIVKGIANAESSTLVEVAAASMVMRQLTFGGVMRSAKTSDALNVKWTKDQLKNFGKWRYTFPPVYPCQIRHTYQSAIQTADCISPNSAIAWVDPPYYLPKEMGHMDPAYPGHRPHDRATLEMGIDALQRTARLPFVHTLIYSNYSSPEHDSMTYAALMDRGYDEIKCVNFGKLDTMHQANGESRVEADELILVAHKTGVVSRQLSLI